MIPDTTDQQPGEKKGRRRYRWRPPLRDVILVATTILLSVTATCLYFTPMRRRAQQLEKMFSIPNMHIETVESPGTRPGEMDFTISLVNLGSKAVDIQILTQPMQDWVAFTGRSTVKVVPTRQVRSQIGQGKAMVKFLKPLAAGFPTSVTFTALTFTPGPNRRIIQSMRTYVYADKHEQRINFSTSMRPTPQPPRKTSSDLWILRREHPGIHRGGGRTRLVGDTGT